MSSQSNFPLVSRQKILITLLIVNLCLICYGVATRNGWSRDDEVITGVLTPQSHQESFSKVYKDFSFKYGSSALAGFFRPLGVLSFIAEERLWGLRPGAFHLTNLFLHTIAALLLFNLVFRVTASLLAGGLSAVFFAIHPVQFEAVGLIHNRNDLFCLVFLLSTFLLFDSYLKTKKQPFLLLSSACYLLALLGKESAVLFPLVLFVYQRILPFQTKEKNTTAPKNFLLTYGLHIIALLAYLFIRNFALGYIFQSHRVWGYYNFLPGTGLFWQLATAIKLLAYYTWLLVNSFDPFNYCADYLLKTANGFFEPNVLIGLAGLVGFFWVVIRFRRKFPVGLLGATWFFITYLPISNLIPIGNMFAEHYLYTPSAGFFMIMGSFFAGLFVGNNTQLLSTRRNQLLALFIIMTIVFWSRATFLRNYYLRDDKSLWAYSSRHSLASPRTHLIVGQYLIKAGNLDLAEKELQLSLKNNPDYYPANMMLGYVYKQQGRLDEARKFFSTAAAWARRNKDTQSLQEAADELKSLDAFPRPPLPKRH